MRISTEETARSTCTKVRVQRPKRPAAPLPPREPFLLPPLREPPLEKTGRAGWRPDGTLKLGILKLDRAGMGRPASEPESYEVDESCRGLLAVAGEEQAAQQGQQARGGSGSPLEREPSEYS